MSTAPATAAIDALYLSPHLDDVALSCGGQIHARTRRGQRVLIVTVFAGSAPPTDRLSSFTTGLHRMWGLGDDPVATRRAEDRRAVAELGASCLHLELPDAIYRADAAGLQLYPSLTALFGQQSEEDAAMPATLRAMLRDLPDSAFLAAPLGVGEHVDHLLVHRAALDTIPAERLWLYEEFPYAERFRARLRAASRRGGWGTSTEALTEADVAARCRAIACYASQLGAAFQSNAELERRVRRFSTRRGGERLWHRLR